jgi:hypothetical protein
MVPEIYLTMPGLRLRTQVNAAIEAELDAALDRPRR